MPDEDDDLRDFDAEDEDELTRPGPKPFRLGGQTWHPLPSVPAGAVLALGAGAVGTAAQGRFIMRVLPPDEAKAFDSMLDSLTVRISAKRLLKVYQHLVEGYSDRPTEPPAT